MRRGSVRPSACADVARKYPNAHIGRAQAHPIRSFDQVRAIRLRSKIRRPSEFERRDRAALRPRCERDAPAIEIAEPAHDREPEPAALADRGASYAAFEEFFRVF